MCCAREYIFVLVLKSRYLESVKACVLLIFWFIFEQAYDQTISATSRTIGPRP